MDSIINKDAISNTITNHGLSGNLPLPPPIYHEKQFKSSFESTNVEVNIKSDEDIFQLSNKDKTIPFKFTTYKVVDIDKTAEISNKVINNELTEAEAKKEIQDSQQTIFLANNWVDNKQHLTIKEIDKKGAAVWLYTDGEYAFRRSVNSKVNRKMLKSKLKMVLNKLLNQIVIIDDESDKIGAIKTFDLKMVSEDTFNPHIMEEFYEKDGEVFRNTFRPTKYMFLDKGQDYNKPKAILKLLEHLTNYRPDRTNWVINWLAYFYQNLKKSPVAWVAKGPQGGGKGILFEKILSVIFGSEQSIQVNDKSIKGNFIGSIVENKLIINLDEISTGMKSNKEVKNQLKAIVSNSCMTTEKKFENIKETELFAMIFITTNEPQALEIEFKDRRFTVYTTGGNIANTNFLEYGTFDNFIEAIENELLDFAHMLNNYPVDIKLATTAQNTPEKDALVGATTDRFHQFYVALLKKDIDYFEDLKIRNSISYQMLENSFFTNRISKASLKDFFNNLEEENISAKKLLLKLRTIDAFFFSDEENSIGTITGDRLYKLDSEYNIYKE